MKIIGHRGAAGLAPENSLEAIKAGIKAGVDAIEFDIRCTADGELVLSHDATTMRTHGVDRRVKDMHSHEVSKIRSPEGIIVPTLDQAVRLSGNTYLFIEGKSDAWAQPLSEYITKHSLKRCSVISFNHSELSKFKKLSPKIKTYVLEHRNPFDAINAARTYNFDGIDFNFWTLNPLTYWLARRHKFEIAVFTVNKSWLASFLNFLYPRIAITTNNPERMQHLRDGKKRGNTV